MKHKIENIEDVIEDQKLITVILLQYLDTLYFFFYLMGHAVHYGTIRQTIRF